MPDKRVADFLFEVGMLQKTPRTGFQFLGNGRQSVSDHAFRTTMIGFCLARTADGVDREKVVSLCLVHDLPEARTGDINYLNKRYVTSDELAAAEDMCQGLPFGDEIMSLVREFTLAESAEAKLAHDADQLDLICELKAQQDLGNPYAADWLHFALKRLLTEPGRNLAEAIVHTDHTGWWFDRKSEWWVNGGKEEL